MHQSEETWIAPNRTARPVVGVVPAAGHAKRWRGQLRSSKELYPIERSLANERQVPVVAGLLAAFYEARVARAIVVTRAQKWDIPLRLLDGREFGCSLAYIVIDSSPSVPHSVAAAIPFLNGCDVALGFPDVVFYPPDALRTLVAARSAEKWDVLLGLFETNRPEQCDMVDLEDRGSVRQIVVKQPSRDLRYAWLLALWTPRFTAYLSESLPSGDESHSSRDELQFGHVLQSAIEAGLSVVGIPVAGGRFLDLGSPEAVDGLTVFPAGD